ncbi:hypothetical protein A0U94_05860 [Gluconobacter albidus]|uniref:restriction endonuclease subunit S n=1 Tax=Gluconobacter albidus TaxID=318683 RepID=UPI00098A1425|nr:restriction endonuclease subunit S [Gluconobacter albidus]AQS90563.1 hypothetical protein A0U94_05860 [Gluconobacter albidus]
MSWDWVAFADAPLQIIDGDRGKQYPKQSDFLSEGPCLFLNTGNVTTNGFAFADTMFVSEQKDAALRKGKLTRDDIVMTTRGTIGNCAYYHAQVPYESVRINSGMVIFRAQPERLVPAFLYHYLRSDVFGSKAQAIRSGAAQPQLPIRDIKTIDLPLPPLPNQKRIAAILSAYDDLIENNRRRIALLEEAARQLYKEWFVRFRFPGHEHVKIIDGVPDGWERKLLGEIARVVMGQSPQSKFYNDAGIGLPFHQGVTNYGFRFVSHHTYSSAVTKLAEANDILVSVRAPVGRINITLDRIVLGRGLSAIRSKSGHQSFLLYALKEHFYAEDIIGTGAIYAATNKKELEAQQMLIPVGPLVTAFEDASLPIDRQITNLTKSVEYLTKARDLLLPKLMSGAIAV